MKKNTTKRMSKVIRIDESEIRGHLDEMVRGTVEETLNAMFDAEADEMCKSQRYEHSPEPVPPMLCLSHWIFWQNWRHWCRSREST